MHAAARRAAAQDRAVHQRRGARRDLRGGLRRHLQDSDAAARAGSRRHRGRQAAPRRCRPPTSPSGARWWRPSRIPRRSVDIGMVGKYVQIRDSYISLNEALMHGGIQDAHARQHPLFRVAGHRAQRPAPAQRTWTRSWCRAGSATAASRARSRRCAMRASTRIPVSRHLPRHAAGDHRVRPARARPEGRQQHRVRPRHEPSGDRADHRMAGPRAAQQVRDREFAPWAAACARVRRRLLLGRAHCARDALRQGLDHASGTAIATSSTTHYLDELPPAGLSFSGFLGATVWWSSSSSETIRGSWRASSIPEFTSTPRDGHPLFAGFVRAARAYRAALAARPRRGMNAG